MSVTGYTNGAIGNGGLVAIKSAEMRKSDFAWPHLRFHVEAQTTSADDRTAVGSQWVTPFGIVVAFNTRAGFSGEGANDDMDRASDLAEDILTAVCDARTYGTNSSVLPVSYVVGQPDDKGVAMIQILINVRHKFGA